MDAASEKMVQVGLDRPIWEAFFMVSPLVIVGSREDDTYNFAPKHMAMPLGWDAFFGFVCAPTHRTYTNIRETKAFTVSFPTTNQIVEASLAATSRRDAQGKKPVLRELPQKQAAKIDGVLIDDAAVCLECTLDRIVDDFGRNSLIAGKIVAAYVREDFYREADVDDQELIFKAPLLAYLHPGRYAKVSESYSFPFPSNFEK